MPKRKHFYPSQTRNHLSMLRWLCLDAGYCATVYPDGTLLCKDMEPGEDPEVCSHHVWIDGAPWYAVEWFLFS